MGEAVGHDIALRALLQRVVADLVGGVERLLDVARLEQTLLVGVIGPDTGEAVGLQLDAHRKLVGIGLPHRPAHLVELGQDADEVLHVMPDLVRDHIGLGEITRGVELPFELVVEGEVDIDLVVARAVERPRRHAGEPAGRTDAPGEEHELRLLVGLAARLEDSAPDILRLGQHRSDELLHLVVALRRHLTLAGRHRNLPRPCLVEDLYRIDAEGLQDEEEHDQDDDAGNPAAARAADPHPARDAETGRVETARIVVLTAAVLDIVALPAALPAHPASPLSPSPAIIAANGRADNVQPPARIKRRGGRNQPPVLVTGPRRPHSAGLVATRTVAGLMPSTTIRPTSGKMAATQPRSSAEPRRSTSPPTIEPSATPT